MVRIEPAPPAPRWQQPNYELRNPYANRHGSRPRAREKTEAGYSYEHEDQSHGAIRLGMRVKHRQFGTGTVLAVEDAGDDCKVTVRFPTVGAKKLLARFAGLEPA